MKGVGAIPRPVAIDGPSASGKSTVARRVAKELSRLYVDSGSVYRAITWLALQQGVGTSDNWALADMMDNAKVEFDICDGAVRVSVNGRAIGPEIKSEEVNRHVSPVAAQPEVRRRIVDWLRGMVELGPLVMEGRDIGTVVFPDTPYKFYLDASPEERARRRHAETAGGGTVDEVRTSISRRDNIDSSRAVAPLKIAGDATLVDSTSKGAGEVVEFILARVRAGTKENAPV